MTAKSTIKLSRNFSRTPADLRPRGEDAASVIADHVLDRYEREAGWIRSLPVPVEQIVERCYGLRIEWAELVEPPGVSILGALEPSDRRIWMNERHVSTIFTFVGPIEFTIAHELGHWINDVIPSETGDRVFCRANASTDAQVAKRETQANRFAARLLLPTDLLSNALTGREASDLDALALKCGVSRAMLRIRLEELPRRVE